MELKEEVMKKNILGACLVILLVTISLANAQITSWYCDDDNDGAIVMGTQNWSSGGGEYGLAWKCTQNAYPGHVDGTFTTDSPSDPKVLIDETVLNDTGVAWNDYHITIGMTNTFSISNIITPDNWIYNIGIVAPGTIPNGGGPGYVATIDYYMGSGAPILNNAEGEFGFKLTFLGSVAFTAEQVPSFVPEPATITLLCIGALALTKRKK
jgi:hypothetical protein